ncbi:MFS transporter [Microbacterium capsulatum]|uniref:MFS transporter n=1 Tax=Microbacterium capsulatum TaxID=3041921 RepID=A0ABU0XLQ7_9MICO|nr:MFS transporter [Microbacterium sp. ASV81]MDQ4215767.1 MFS transporter [Microbacterium sp. ASV81]
MTASDTSRTAHWSGVLAMSLCVFALIAAEFMPVSLLTPIAAGLEVTEGAAGQGIAISGLFAVITSLSISRLAGRMDRKTLLLVLTAVMTLSSALIAVAPTYLVYLVGRAMIGVVIGGFWSMSISAAMRLVPDHHVPRALAIFNGGNALAAVVAAPIGSFLGAVIGWQGAFWCLVPVSVLALVWQWISLPSMPPPPRSAAHVFGALRSRTVARGMAACGAFFAGQFLLFTYVRPFLERVTRLDPTAVALVLLIVGIGGLLGTVLIERVLRHGSHAALVVIPVLMALIAAALVPAGSWLAPVAVLLALWGLLGTSAPVGWASWVAHTLTEDPEAGGGLQVAVIQLSIALGSTVGGVIFDHLGHLVTFLTSAAVLLLSAALAASLRPRRGDTTAVSAVTTTR